jgi:hypothetical protein
MIVVAMYTALAIPGFLCNRALIMIPVSTIVKDMQPFMQVLSDSHD